jgi:hypothetical protein
MWKRIVAPILDFIMVFSVGGYLIGPLPGRLQPGGFDSEGWPAALLFALDRRLLLCRPARGRRHAVGPFFGIVRPQPR